MNKKVDALENHIIVCGYGRNGQQIVHELHTHKESFIIIENNEEAINELNELGTYLFLNGDATNDELLLKAGVEKARALITALPSDADNLFVVLTARELNPSMTIVSRAAYKRSEHKLKAAGATNVIMPGKIGGTRMAKLVMQPNIVEFIESIMLQSENEVHIHEVSCENIEKCQVSEKSITSLSIRKKCGANIIGLKKELGEFVFNPPPETILNFTDTVFALGTPQDIKTLKQILQGEL